MACSERYEVVDEVFERLDTRNSGFLGVDELRVFADATGFEGDDESWVAMFNEIAEVFTLGEGGMSRDDFAALYRGFVKEEDEEDFVNLLSLDKNVAYPHIASSTRAPSLSSTGEKEQTEEVREFDVVTMSEAISPRRMSNVLMNYDQQMLYEEVDDQVNYGLNPYANVFVPRSPEEIQRALRAAWRRGGFKALYAEGFLFDEYYHNWDGYDPRRVVKPEVTKPREPSMHEQVMSANFSGNWSQFSIR